MLFHIDVGYKIDQSDDTTAKPTASCNADTTGDASQSNTENTCFKRAHWYT